MVKKVGLTGGIGSGKTTVAKVLKALGYPVYCADKEAKELMNASVELIDKITNLLGEKSYLNNQLNRPYVASMVFNDQALLKQLNGIVHPAVEKHFNDWCLLNGKKKIVFQESAIHFENGSHKRFDKMLLVIAPVEERIKRVMHRDTQSLEEVKARINNQWSDDKKSKLADYIIKCDGKHLLIPQVFNVLKDL